MQLRKLDMFMLCNRLKDTCRIQHSGSCPNTYLAWFIGPGLLLPGEQLLRKGPQRDPVHSALCLRMCHNTLSSIQSVAVNFQQSVYLKPCASAHCAPSCSVTTLRLSHLFAQTTSGIFPAPNLLASLSHSSSASKLFLEEASYTSIP